MMDYLKGLSLTSIEGILTTLLLVVLSAFVIYYFYKNIYPPKSRSYRITLRTLRSLVFIILSIQISMLVINWSTLSEKKKEVGILLDGSKSMAQYENSPFVEIHETVDKITSSIGNEVEVKKYLFDSELRDYSTVDRAEGDITDISKSLKTLLKENRSKTMSAKPDQKIFSGDYSRDMWGQINKAKTTKQLRWALYAVCCSLQELEARVGTPRSKEISGE